MGEGSSQRTLTIFHPESRIEEEEKGASQGEVVRRLKGGYLSTRKVPAEVKRW